MQTTRRLTTTVALGVGIVLIAGAGVATATVGKSLLLGKTNTAKTITTLSNPKGIPLSLKAKSGKPPLEVNTKVVVPNLNSSLLGGKSASSFQTKIKTDEQCNHQPGSDVTGLASTGEFTCDSQQAVQNGNNPGGAPGVTVHTQGEYLIFANLELDNSSAGSVSTVCQITWQNGGSGVPVAESADATDVNVPANAGSNTNPSIPLALGTSGAQQITAASALTASCTGGLVSVASGDVTVVPVTFQ